MSSRDVWGSGPEAGRQADRSVAGTPPFSGLLTDYEHIGRDDIDPVPKEALWVTALLETGRAEGRQFQFLEGVGSDFEDHVSHQHIEKETWCENRRYAEAS
jgi:hypothetical protein